MSIGKDISSSIAVALLAHYPPPEFIVIYLFKCSIIYLEYTIMNGHQ